MLIFFYNSIISNNLFHFNFRFSIRFFTRLRIHISDSRLLLFKLKPTSALHNSKSNNSNYSNSNSDNNKFVKNSKKHSAHPGCIRCAVQTNLLWTLGSATTPPMGSRRLRPQPRSVAVAVASQKVMWGTGATPRRLTKRRLRHV